MNNTMKTISLISGILLAATLGQATTISWDSSFGTPLNITDGSAAGISTGHLISGIADVDQYNNSIINGVDVRLNISGGFNGDLYGYLVLQDQNGNVASTVLLNRMGTAGGNPFGSAGAGMNVTLSDSGTVNGDIHAATGVPTGVWQVDQYQSVGNSLNGNFATGTMSANGTWTLFLADLSQDGSTAQLVSWGLDISVVPEPVTWALVGFAGVVGVGILLRRRGDLQNVAEKISGWVDAV